MRGLLMLMIIGLISFLVCVPPASTEGLRPLEGSSGIQLPRWNPRLPLVEKLAQPLYQAAWTLEGLEP